MENKECWISRGFLYLHDTLSRQYNHVEWIMFSRLRVAHHEFVLWSSSRPLSNLIQLKTSLYGICSQPGVSIFCCVFVSSQWRHDAIDHGCGVGEGRGDNMLHIEIETKWPPFCRPYFKIIFFNEMKTVVFLFKIHQNLLPRVQLTTRHHWFR